MPLGINVEIMILHQHSSFDVLGEVSISAMNFQISHPLANHNDYHVISQFPQFYDKFTFSHQHYHHVVFSFINVKKNRQTFKCQKRNKCLNI